MPVGPTGWKPVPRPAHLLFNRAKPSHKSELRVTREQRRQTPRIALALWVASLFVFGCVAPRSSRNGGTDMLPRRALFKQKNRPTPIYEMASKQLKLGSPSPSAFSILRLE
jgi:hypothetical protein